MTDRTWGLYVHVPYCRIRCPYCSFYLVESDQPVGDRFVDRVLAEWEERRPTVAGRPSTLYLGGGTPSRLEPQALAKLLGGLPSPVSGEVSAEVNPEDLGGWLQPALDAGISRISLGLQSPDGRRARHLGRAHTAAVGRRSLAQLAKAPLRSWSVDLLFGTPGQTVAELDAELDVLVGEGVPHLSAYGLTVEPGTRYERLLARGRRQLPDEDAWRALYDRLVERLDAAGLNRYEVSNFARAGHECEHNLGYWRDVPYLALGPGAHGYLPDGRRYANLPDLNRWFAESPTPATWETPEPRQAATDLLLSALRTREGLSLTYLMHRVGLALDPALLRQLERRGWIRVDQGTVVVESSVLPIADTVVLALLEGLVPCRTQAGSDVSGMTS